MKIDINYINKHKVELLVESDWESIKEHYQEVLEDYAQVSIKGFRAGKAPRKIVEQRFGSRILKEVGTQCSQNLCKQAMNSRELIAGSPISISDIHLRKGAPITFKAGFIRMAEFELPDYIDLVLVSATDEGKRDEISRILLEQTEVEIPDEMIQQEMELSGLQADPSDEENWNAAKERVSLLLILSKIAEQDGIEVDDRDVEDRIQLVANENGTTSSELKQVLLSNGGLSRLSNYMRAESVLDYIIEQSK